MPTLKPRINITLSNQLDVALLELSRRDKVPRATKAAELLRFAIESEEDQIWDTMAQKRDTKKAKFIPHDQVWK